MVKAKRFEVLKLNKHLRSMKTGLSITLSLAGALSVASLFAQAPPREENRVGAKPGFENMADTTKKSPTDTIGLPVPEVLKGRRPSTTVEGEDISDRFSLPYDQIRIDDQVYRQVIWREIPVRERMNMPFIYEASEDNGTQRFFDILLRHVKDGDVTPFSALDDRFTTPITSSDIARDLVGQPYVMSVSDWAQDPDGSLGIMRDTMIRDEFDPESIVAYRVKEEVIFDKETSRLHWRILGIAPLKAVKNNDGSFRDSYPLFWLYYPDLRPYLVKYEAYNPRNMAARMSWDDLFESRYFSSFIYKSTLNNPFDRPLSGYINDPLMRLLEGDNIKNTIFNWEQDQWEY